MVVKVMRASDAAQITDVPLPVMVTPKIDGFRGLVLDGQLYSSTMKPIPNRFVNSILSNPMLSGLDGEIVVGPVTAPDVFNVTSSGLRSREGEPDFKFLVFDFCDQTLCATDRLSKAQDIISCLPDSLKARVELINSRRVISHEELAVIESAFDAAGYEGAMCRGPNSPYKFGRSTLKEGYLLKRKPTTIDEAVIIGHYEMMNNENEAYTSEDGRTVRSSSQDGLVPAGILGGFVVQEVGSDIKFDLGGGFTMAEREEFWKVRDSMIGAIVRFKHMPYGRVDKPRQPVFKGIRPDFDFDTV